MPEVEPPVDPDPDDGYELVSDLNPENEILWRVRPDRATYDAFDLVVSPEGGLTERRIDYTGRDSERWQFRPFEGGVRVYRKKV